MNSCEEIIECNCGSSECSTIMGVGKKKLKEYLAGKQITVEELKKGNNFLKPNKKNPILMTGMKKNNWICP